MCEFAGGHRVRVVVEADGGSRGNPGPAGYGAVVLDPGTDRVLAERSEFIGTETNNVAEYRALVAGLEAARDLGATEVAVRMDSQLVVEQMKGTWQVRNEGLRPLAARAAALAEAFETVSFEWVPRERNTRADRLANQAMDGNAAGPAELTPPPAWTPPTDRRTRLVLVRHGSTVHSAERRFSGRNDLPLDPAGSAQAAALAARIREFGEIAALVSSPLRRARQTADWLASALRVDVVDNDGFAEVDFGEWEGMSFAEIRARDAAALAAWLDSADLAPPGGESQNALAQRVREARDSIVAAHPGATIVVVTHVSPIKSLVRSALDAPPSSLYRMHLDTASVSIVDYAGDGVASLRLFNDTSHLARR